MKIGNIELKNNLILAPLAGYTNKAYREIMKSFGVGLVFSEMVSAKGLVYENDKTFEYLISSKEERPIAIQLFGSEESDLKKATEIVTNSNYADIIDINMGCPVKKVIKQGAGSALLSEIDKVYNLTRTVVTNTNLPVSVKIRAGIDHNHINCIEVAKAIEQAGASLITIHGRTKSDGFTGKVNLDYIKMVKDNVSIPVIGNGDIKSSEDYQNMLKYTNCDGVMVGRATLGNPWVLEEILTNKKRKISRQERIDMIRRHYQLLKELKSTHISLLEMRSLSIWYLKGIPNTKEYILRIMQSKSEQEFLKIIEEIEAGE